MRPIGGVEVQIYSFMTTALEGGEGSASRPSHSLPLGKTWYPLYRRLGGPQGRSGQVRKILPPPGFDPWTVQPVASCYTNYATRPTSILLDADKLYIMDHFHYLALQTLTTQQPCHVKACCAPYGNIWIVWQLILPYLLKYKNNTNWKVQLL